MKKVFVMISLFVIALFAFGQTTDSTAVVTYNFGDSVMEFLKSNMWTLLFVIMYFLSEWIGESESIPEGSVWRKVVNFLFNLAKKKATESPKMKAMKRKHEEELKAAAKPIASEKKSKGNVAKILIVAVLLSGISVAASSQNLRVYPFQKRTLTAVEDNLNGSMVDSTLFFGASVSFDVFTREVKTGNYAIGAIPGVGYGFKWNPKWNPLPTKSFLSFDLFAQGALDKQEAAEYFNIRLLPMVGIFDWIRIGYGPVFKIGVNGTEGYNTGMFAISISTTL